MNAVSFTIFARFFIISLLVTSMFPTFSQSPYNCTVVAKIFPDGDSVTTLTGPIDLQNASINATSYRFIVGFVQLSLNEPATIFPNIGLNKVQLVAYNGACTDTITSYYFFSGTYPSDTSSSNRAYGEQLNNRNMFGLLTLNDQSNLSFGERVANGFKSGIILKTKPEGCIEWARKLPDSLYGPTAIYRAKEALDGNIYMLSGSFGEMQLLSKVSANGNIIWTKGIQDPEAYPHRFFGITTMPDGGVVTVSSPPFNRPEHYLTRFDRDGNIVWQNYNDSNLTTGIYFSNMLVKDGFLYIGGYLGVADQYFLRSHINKVDLNTGVTLWSKHYSIDTTQFSIVDLVSVDDDIVFNIEATSPDPSQRSIGGIVRIDTSGNVLKAKIFTENLLISTTSGSFILLRSRMIKSGNSFHIISNGFYPISLQGNGTSSKRIMLDANLEVKWAQSGGQTQQYWPYLNAPAPNEGVTLGGFIRSFGHGGTLGYSFGGMMLIQPMDSLGGNPNTSCYNFYQLSNTSTLNLTVTPIQWWQGKSGNHTSITKFISWENDYPEMRFNCSEYVDSCSFLKIIGKNSVCNISQTYIYKIVKNKACGQTPNWQVSADIQIVSQTDSSITVRFLDFGQHVIYTRFINGCVPVQDSIVVTAASSYGPLNLGNDAEICVGNTILLSAGNSFAAYEWQDGSTDSTLLINQPGTYWVRVVDSCTNIMYDSIVISLNASVSISIGEDTSLCYGDTIQLIATAGFVNYQWSPAYQTNTTLGETIAVSPLRDTFYTVIAELTPGCFAYDTVIVAVNSVPNIDLGNDTSFCFGDSITLSVGNGFSSVIWSNGSTNETIIAKTEDTYFVLVTTQEGCVGRDSLKIINVYDLPHPTIQYSPLLCEGTINQLDAGRGFIEYRWNTGASSQAINVNTLGEYIVLVKDVNGCIASDTASIITLQPIPKEFLGPDIVKCDYEKVTLIPRSSFINYLWNNGSNNTSITVSDPGLYRLQATDRFGCIGNDSILVTTKPNCIEGVYVPNTFTPNADGRNDFFRPLIYGNIQSYSITIYNRYGIIVFQSTNPLQSWDGRFKGQQQDSNAFTWLLTFQLNGNPLKKLNGTVLLLR